MKRTKSVARPRDHHTHKLPPESMPQVNRDRRIQEILQGPAVRGFTLIEIMIVVAIIGLLAGVAIPNYLDARRTTQMRTCIINLQNIEGAVERWAMEANKAPDQAVTFKDISPYLKHRVACPAGGTTFEDSYELTRIETAPICLRAPEGKYPHKLPL